MRGLPVLTLILPVALATDPPVISSSAATDAAPQAEVSIVEPPFRPPQSWAYEPSAMTVKVGRTVTWTNTGAVIHTVTADDRKTFNSGNIRPKASFSVTPSSPGTFAYHCVYHPWMRGAVTVQP
jgi:plastocyanin